jgi:anti-sigma B factor antagonist
MTIQLRVVGSVAILDLNGRLVMGDGDSLLKDRVHSLVFEGQKDIVLNLANLDYVDSTGLGALVATSVTARNSGGQVKLLNVTRRLKDLLSITKLLMVFDSFDSEPDALRSFAAPTA